MSEYEKLIARTKGQVYAAAVAQIALNNWQEFRPSPGQPRDMNMREAMELAGIIAEEFEAKSAK